MEKIQNGNKLFNMRLIYQLIYFPFFFFLISLNIKGILLETLDSFELNILNEDASLIDITDYFNLYPIITTDKKLYLGIPPLLNKTLNSKIINISAAITYNENFFLIACTQNYLLSKINIETGEETGLISYKDINIPNCTCSISSKDNFVYIGISHIIIPKIMIKKTYDNDNKKQEIEDNNISTIDSIYNSDNINYSDYIDINSTIYTDDISQNIYNNISDSINNEEDDYYIFDDYYNSYLENTAIKIKLNNDENNEPFIDEDFKILFYAFNHKQKSLENIDLSRPFSCEIINIENNEDSRLVCGYIIEKQTGNNTFLYSSNVTVMNSDFNNIENETTIKTYKEKPYLRLQRIDSNNIRYFVMNNSFEISLKIKDSKCILVVKKDYFSIFDSSEGLFFYNNQYLFSAISSGDLYIMKISSDNYLQANEKTDVKKIIGYYKEKGDILLFLYENSKYKIKYFTIENLGILYSFKSKPKVKEVKSNTSTIFNVTELISDSVGISFLDFQSVLYYISTKIHNKTYEKFDFNRTSQILTVYPSLNDWVLFEFSFKGEKSGIPIVFIMDKCTVTIRTCLFKCGSCSTEYDICDNGTCKTNFSLYEDSEDNECYPADQNFPNYIHNKSTNFFEKCFPTCKFCSQNEKYSNYTLQNCKVCEDGYLRSYKYLGNCFQIDYPKNISNFSKIVYNIKDFNFSIVNSCLSLGKYQIFSTGECVDNCPDRTVYYSYSKNTSLNFSQQQETSLGLLYSLNKENSPKYLFNNFCYSSCPSLTFADKINKICRCTYAWHNDTINDKIICYNMSNYCSSLDYYYHIDTRECVLYGCKDDYFQINFECYKDKCPANSIEISNRQCESTKKYCYINETYRTVCGDLPIKGYNLRYNNSKLYFRFCNESFYYFNITTYLYKNICYEYCPEETTKNETNKRCSCNFYIYYVNKEKTDYKCLKENEKCRDKKKYNITDKRECVDTFEECVADEHLAFNDECSLICPNNTQTKEGGNICYCLYNYYNKSNFLTCFDEGITCENNSYPIKMESSISNECFLTKYECIKRKFKFYNYICYDKCPKNTTEKKNDGICTCLYNYFNNSDMLECFEKDETCKEKGYNYINIDTGECFISLDNCIKRGLKIFNDNCYSICPTNTKQKGNNSCICSYYFYTEKNNTLNCFDKGKTCENEGYQYIDYNNKECFKSIDDCFNKNYLFYYDKTCYKNNCPSDKIPLNSIKSPLYKSSLIEDLNLDNKYKEKLCICEVENSYKGWIISENLNNPIQKCLKECPFNYELDKDSYKCEDIYPDLFYKDRNKCPYIYNKSCCFNCPENTCLDNSTKYFAKCIEFNPDTMKIYNRICIERITEVVQILINNNEDDIEPIITSSGVIISGFSTDALIDDLIVKYPGITFIDLGECKDKLIKAYKLPSDDKLYIIGIETPNFYGNSSINVFDYEVYLKNGTQLEDISPCDDTKITVLSKIQDLEIVKFDKAIEFYENGNYDIYNKSDKFYVSLSYHPLSSGQLRLL